MMSIDEAIAHEKEVAKEIYVEAMLCHANPDDGKLDGCIERGKYHEQVAEWLEDYKQIKMLVPIEQALKAEYNKGYSKAESDYHAQSEKDRQSSYDCGYEVGYAKAIDDFVNFANTMPTVEEEDGEIRPMRLEEIAEQLKAGGENDSI